MHEAKLVRARDRIEVKETGLRDALRLELLGRIARRIGHEPRRVEDHGALALDELVRLLGRDEVLVGCMRRIASQNCAPREYFGGELTRKGHGGRSEGGSKADRS